MAGVKVATQTPPVRSGRRVVFLTLDDSTGPSDCTFFEDVQGPYAGVVFHSWLLLVRGILRRTGDRGVSIRATGAWELAALWDAWQLGGLSRCPGRDRRRRGGRRRPRPRRWSRRPESATPAPVAGCSSTPRGSSSRPTPTSSHPAPTRARAGAHRAPWCPRNPPRRCPRASCGTPAPAAPDTRVGAGADHRPRGTAATAGPSAEGDPPWPTSGADPAVRAPTPGCARPRCRRRSTPSRPGAAPSSGARCASSTSGAAPAARPSRSRRPATTSPSSTRAPTPWPRCSDGPPTRAPRRACTAVQGDTDSVGEARPAGERPAYDLVCLHGTLEVVDDPDTALANVAAVLLPGAPSRSSSPSASRPSLARAVAGAVRPGPGDPRAARRALGRRRPRPPAVRRAGGARAARPRTASPPSRATACASSATSCRRPSSTPRPTGPPCSSSRRSRASTPTTRCSGDLGSVRHVLATRD